jgi:hypothetical protein
MPDTEEERLDKQLNRLTRKARTSLRPVMAYLYEIVSAKYRDLPQNEKDTEIRKEMVRGLVRFFFFKFGGDMPLFLIYCFFGT